MTLEPGTQIGKYVLGRKLGQGGFGVVFRAHDASLDREVALKFLHPEHTSTPQMLQRFLQEARSAAKIMHPGIVTVFECGQMTEAEGAAYIAMELLVGETLTDRLARLGCLTPAAATEIVRQVAAALAAAHRVGIVHRDLKPDNIFLVADPAVRGGERVKVLDFGIAKLGRAATSSVQTHSMMVFGTPRYMSPEQCKSSAGVDHRSDIYTLGCILFELVCGKPPFAGEPGELIAQHLLVPPPTAMSIIPDLPVGLDKLIAAMLAKPPDARPQTMAVVQLALEPDGAGVELPGVAPTLAADALSLPPQMTPGAFGARPAAALVGSTDPTMTVMQPMAHPAAHPTTLGVATGASVVPSLPPARRSRGAIYAACGVLAMGAIVAAGFAMHGSGGDSGGGGSEPARAVAAAPAPAPAPAAAAAPAPAPAAPAAAAPTPTPTPTPTPVPPAPTVPAKTIDKPATATARGSAIVAAIGTIALSSRPVCDILIDGSPAGLHTPQRELKLAAGRHKITLVDAEHKIKDSFVVIIKPGQVQTIDKDYLPKSAAAPSETTQPPATPPPPPPVDTTPKKDGTINPFAHKPGSP